MATQLASKRLIENQVSPVPHALGAAGMPGRTPPYPFARGRAGPGVPPKTRFFISVGGSGHTHRRGRTSPLPRGLA